MIHLFQLYIHYPYPNDIPNSKYHIVPSSISEFLNISVASVHFLSIVSHSFCTFSQPKFTQVTRESWGNQPPWWWVGTLTPPFHCISWNYMELPPFFLSTIDSFPANQLKGFLQKSHPFEDEASCGAVPRRIHRSFIRLGMMTKQSIQYMWISMFIIPWYFMIKHIDTIWYKHVFVCFRCSLLIYIFICVCDHMHVFAFIHTPLNSHPSSCFVHDVLQVSHAQVNIQVAA